MANITEAFVNAWSATMTLRSQQMDTRLRSGVRVETGIRGTSESYDFIGKRKPKKRKSRHGDTITNDSVYDRRWVDIFRWDDAELIDKPDVLRTLTDPTNVVTAAMAAGFGRTFDEVLMEAAIGAARTGQGGSGSAALPASQQQTVAGGMTIPKMQTTKRILDAQERGVRRHWAITARQEEDMLGLDQIRSADYNTIRALVNGEVNSFMGFMWHRVEDPILKISAGNLRETVAWVEEALLLGIGEEVTASIDRRPDKNNSMQAMYTADFGAVRLDDLGVVQQQMDET